MSEWAETWSDDEENELDVITNFIRVQNWSEVVNRADYILGLEKNDKKQEFSFSKISDTLSS